MSSPGYLQEFQDIFTIFNYLSWQQNPYRVFPYFHTQICDTQVSYIVLSYFRIIVSSNSKSPPKPKLTWDVPILDVVNWHTQWNAASTEFLVQWGFSPTTARECHYIYLFPLYVMLPTGSTPTAVPVQKTSSPSSNSSTGTVRSSTCLGKLSDFQIKNKR